jgi:hypothetical protein
MKIVVRLRALGACVILLACFATGVMPQPQPVPRMTERALEEASYIALAKEWQAYIEKHGETVDALVNLGMAQRYSGALEAARIAGKRAVELAPDNPKALHFYAILLCLEGGEETAEALRLLEKCMEVAPDYGDALTTLVATHLHAGELKKASDASKIIFERRIISRPLQDFAYNMLVGLPKGAVLVTNGDNDTFPPLALQAGMNFRTDVVVVNRSLLNAPEYVDSLFREHPLLRVGGTWKPEPGVNASRAIIERWLAEGKFALYFASSVPVDDLGLDVKRMAVEGLNWRAAGNGITPEEAARLVLERYRLDSTTDWDFAWDLVPTVSNMMANYVASMVNLALRDGVPADLKCKLLDKANVIAEFHDVGVLAQNVKALLKKCENR